MIVGLQVHCCWFSYNLLFADFQLIYLDVGYYWREEVNWDENNSVRLHCFHKSSNLKYYSFILLPVLLF